MTDDALPAPVTPETLQACLADWFAPWVQDLGLVVESMTAGTVIQTAGGLITLDAAGNISLAEINSSNATAAAITITSAATSDQGTRSKYGLRALTPRGRRAQISAAGPSRS